MKPEDDRKLAAFLHQHAPEPPPARADLEERLLLALPQQPPSALSRQGGRSQRRWWLSGAIAAITLLAWGGHRILSPGLTPAEIAELETFMLESWEMALAGPPASLDSLPFDESQ